MRAKPGWRCRRSTVLLLFCCSLLAGVALAYFGVAIPGFAAAVSLAVLIICLTGRTMPLLIAVIVLGLAAGCSRGGIYRDQLNTYQQAYESKVTLEVTALDDAIYGMNGQLSFVGSKVVLENQVLAGKVQVSGYGPNAIYQGDRLQVTGKFFDTLGASQGRISYAKIELLDRRPSLLAAVRRNFAAGIMNALPEPLASFALGLLLGKRTTIPDSVKNDLLIVGLTHIVAVSGYNLTILLNASKGLLAAKSKRLNFVFSLSLMGLFLMMTGLSASVVRAAIISSIGLAAGYYGRTIRPVHLILLAAAITAWANPYYMWSDMGWYLSFLAFYGILVVAPFIKRKLAKRWQRSLLAGVAVESISAEIMTLPFTLHYFEHMSLAGLPANILVVTLIPFAMLTSFVAGLFGMLAAPIAGWFAWPAVVVLNYMLDIAHIIAGLPNVFMEHIALSFWQMAASYLLIFGLTLLLHKKTVSRISDKITDKSQTKL